MNGFQHTRNELELRADLAELQLENFYSIMDSAYSDSGNTPPEGPYSSAREEISEGMDFAWKVLETLEAFKYGDESLDPAVSSFREMDNWLDSGFFQLDTLVSEAEDELPREYAEHIQEADRALRSAENIYSEIVREVGVYFQNELDNADYGLEVESEFMRI